MDLKGLSQSTTNPSGVLNCENNRNLRFQTTGYLNIYEDINNHFATTVCQFYCASSNFSRTHSHLPRSIHGVYTTPPL
ncbi:hypothetical protein CEXT_404631 [Caerostris extrusa]|uniref:Uncharacterized protein n=1 Tax=Caerostris extrusa TaxID=172846 RepID=A0AAV4TBK5_CAEEX|nr:hypothetical protein CEXT_404631 [Caerostris extrusa]